MRKFFLKAISYKLQVQLFAQRGYIALVTILIVSAVALSLGTTVSLLAIGQGQSSLALFKGEDTLTLVEGCMEDALMKIQANASYSGGTITRPEGTCSITVSTVSTTYTVTATTTATNYKRSVRAVVTRGTTLTITSWQEIF